MHERVAAPHVRQSQDADAQIRAQFEKAIEEYGDVGLHDWQIAQLADNCMHLRSHVSSFSPQSVSGIMESLKGIPQRYRSKKILGYFGAAKNLAVRAQKMMEKGGMTGEEAKELLGNIGLVSHELLSLRLREYEARSAIEKRKSRKYNMRHNSRA